ncbi:MAG: adenine deaminase [Glaciecola sp.]|jgi:adenine deaminase
MKIVKRVLKFIALLIGIFLICIAIVVFVDKQNTNYLKVENIKFANNNSYLITNVNIIPMNQDTILVDKMVYIKDGLINNIADNIKIKDVEIINAKDKYLIPGLIDMHVHI